MSNIETRIMDIEMDILECEKTLYEIAKQRNFVSVAAMRDWLHEHHRADIWTTAIRSFEWDKSKPAPRKRAPVAPKKPALADILPDPSPIKEEAPVIAPTEEAPEVHALASGATEHRGGRPISYGDKIWSYIELGLTSPKKATVRKAERLAEAAKELIDVIDAEKAEVAALREIRDLEAKLAEAKAKLKAAPAASGHDPAKVRAWASANGITVLTNGRLSEAAVKAYAQAHPDE